MPPVIHALPDRPDTAGTITVPDGDGWLQAAWTWITGVPDGLWYALAAAIVTAGLISSIRIALNAKKNPRSLKGDKFLTFLAAGVSTSVVATGMWKFFGDVLHITNPVARGALFAVFEIAMLASAFRSRRFRLDRAAKRETNPDYDDRRVDVDGIAVWVLALVSGLFAAADETTTTARAVRIVVPLLAAWMWERGLAGELMQFTRTGKRLNLRLTPERVLVRLGIAEPTGRRIDEVARRRRIARFARTAFRLHLLTENPSQGGWIRQARIGWLRWRLRRQTESGNEHLNLAADQAALHDVRLQIALLYGAEEGTSRAAVRELTPLKPVRRREIAAEAHVPDSPSPEDAGPASHPVLTEVRSSLAPAFAPSDARPSQTPPQDENPDGWATANAAENADAKPTESPNEKPSAKPEKTLRKLSSALADDGPESVRKLTAAFARKPGGTNAELAKLAKVSIGSANRHLPKIRAAASGRENPGDSQKRSQAPLITTRIENPKPAVTAGANGHHYKPEENRS